MAAKEKDGSFAVAKQEQPMEVDNDEIEATNRTQKSLWYRPGEDRMMQTVQRDVFQSQNAGTHTHGNQQQQVIISLPVEESQHEVIGEAWNELQFKIIRHGTVYMYDVTKNIEPCKIQFIMDSTIARTDFYARLDMELSMTVLSPGYVSVHIDSSIMPIETFWQTLIYRINNALLGKDVKSHTFASQHELEMTLHNLNSDSRRLLRRRIIGLYVAVEKNMHVAKFVGSEIDVRNILKVLDIALSVNAITDKCKQSAVQASRDIPGIVLPNKIFKEEKRCSMDIIDYLETMKYKEYLQKHYPDVACGEAEHDHTMYQITSSNEEAVKQAMSYLDSYIRRIQKRDIYISSAEIAFIQGENVKIYLMEKLKSVPAHISISDKVHVWCEDSEKLKEAEKMVYYSYETTTVDGKISPEAQSIIDGSLGKIKIYEDNLGTVKQIRFTIDLTADAKDLVDVLQKDRHILDTWFDPLIIKALIALGINNNVLDGFNDVNIQVLEGKSTIRLQGPLSCLQDAGRELKAHVQRIKVLPLHKLPTGAEELLANDKVRSYVRSQLGNIDLSFIGNDNNEVTMVCLSPKSCTDFLNCVLNCFISMKMKKDYFETTQGNDFLEKHANEIYRKEDYICFTARLRLEMDDLQTCYSRYSSGIAAEFLKTHGISILKSLEKCHSVEVKLNEGHILFKGRYNDGEKAMHELEKYITMEILHLEDGKNCRDILESKEGRKKADDIADHYRCSWGIMGCSTYLPECNECRGIEYLTTWVLHDKQCSISVADIDYKSAELDVVIIPVNTCMYGEDVLNKDPSLVSYGKYCTGGKLPIGEWRMWKSDGRFGCKYCVAIITSDVVVDGSKQRMQVIGEDMLYKCITRVFHKLFSQNLYKVAIANMNSDVNAVLAGFQVEQYVETELLFSVKKETETLRWINQIDDSLKATCIRRKVFPKVSGFFSKPNVKTAITGKSILDVGVDCIAVAVSPDMDLSKGYVSNLISLAAGGRLQKDLRNRHTDKLRLGELILADSMDLSKRGIKKLIFGFLPHWSDCNRSSKIIETFVLDSLLLADSAHCTSVAFPALGTGNLEFPLRDVSMSLLDGIDRYMEEASIGYISAVNIAVPTFEDDSMSQLLNIEQKRRNKKKDVKVEATLTDDFPFLIANDDNVTIAVMELKSKNMLMSGDIAMKKSIQDVLSSAKFVDIVFEPTNDMKTGGTDVDQSLWKIVVSCDDSKVGLVNAIKEVINICESRKITSIHVYHSHLFSFAESEQIATIVGTVQETVNEFAVQQYPMRTYKYLRNVTVVTSDHALPSIGDILTQPKGVTGWLYSTSMYISNARLLYSTKPTLQWTKHNFLRANRFVNVMLAGGDRSQLEKAKQDIKELTSQLHGTTVSDMCSKSEEVRAELNPGIIKHLMNESASFYNIWKNAVSMAFDIEVVDTNNDNPVIIRGLFDNILNMEHYLENKFPALPEIDHGKSKNDQMEFQEDHFLTESFVSLSVPISAEDKRRIYSIFPDDIKNLSAMTKLNRFALCEGMINVECAPEIKKEVALTIEALIEKSRNAVVRKITVLSEITLSDVVAKNEKKLPNGVMLEEIEEENAISIVGLESKLVNQVGDDIESWLKKMTKKEPITGMPFSLGLSVFEFKTLKVTVCCQDITTTNVDCVVSAVNETINCELGVARDIANKAGKRYVAECKASIKHNGYLHLTECRETGPGRLKFKNILHVHCPIKFYPKKMMQQLLELHTSVTHCLQLAENLQLVSIAIPFLCTGISGFPIEHSAQQYFKAFAEFRQAKYLREVLLVDIDQQKVSDVCYHMCDSMSRCTSGKGETVQTAMELTLGDSDSMKMYIGLGNMHSVSVEAVVVIEDQKLSGKDEQTKYLLQCAGAQVKRKLSELRKEKRGQVPVTSVTAIHSSGELPSTYVMFAIPPVWNEDKTNFTKLIRITTQHILEEACQLGISKLALPILCFEDEPIVVTTFCCVAMAETILEFTKNKSCTVTCLDILSEDKSAISKMCHKLAEQLHQGYVCAPLEWKERETIV